MELDCYMYLNIALLASNFVRANIPIIFSP